MGILFVAETNIGQKRRVNEDSYWPICGTAVLDNGLARPVDKAPANAVDGCDIGAFEVQ